MSVGVHVCVRVRVLSILYLHSSCVCFHKCLSPVCAYEIFKELLSVTQCTRSHNCMRQAFWGRSGSCADSPARLRCGWTGANKRTLKPEWTSKHRRRRPTHHGMRSIGDTCFSKNRVTEPIRFFGQHVIFIFLRPTFQKNVNSPMMSLFMRCVGLLGPVSRYTGLRIAHRCAAVVG